MGCASELAVRTRSAVDAGLASAQVERLPGWPSDACFTDEHRAALAIAEQFVLDPHGVDAAMRDAFRKFGRQALHARALSFDHPVQGGGVTFEAEIPADMRGLIDFVSGL